MGKDNLSIAHLIDHLRHTETAALHAEVLELHSRIRTDSAQLIKIRNKQIAHNDLAEKQNQLVSLYTGVTRTFIDEQIKGLCSLMNRIHSSLSDTETDYETAGNIPDGSLALLEALQKLDKM